VAATHVAVRLDRLVITPARGTRTDVISPRSFFLQPSRRAAEVQTFPLLSEADHVAGIELLCRLDQRFSAIRRVAGSASPDSGSVAFIRRPCSAPITLVSLTTSWSPAQQVGQVADDAILRFDRRPAAPPGGVPSRAVARLAAARWWSCADRSRTGFVSA
jgi:hypothetical protein